MLATPGSKSLADPEDVAGTVEEAITTRQSIRRFLPKPVPRGTVEHLLSLASRAPSGTNIQPWRVYALAGRKKADLSATILDAHYNSPDDHSEEYKYYPARIPEPYLSRRRKVGWDLYGILGIEKGNGEKMRAQHARNYMFFDAPVGMIFTIERIMEIGSWLDYGTFLQNIMIAARGLGLHTCPQAAFAKYHTIISKHLDIPENEMVVCGMSLGYADFSAPENDLVTEREPIGNFTRFFDL